MLRFFAIFSRCVVCLVGAYPQPDELVSETMCRYQDENYVTVIVNISHTKSAFFRSDQEKKNGQRKNSTELLVLYSSHSLHIFL